MNLPAGAQLVLFLGVFALIVLGMAIWSRYLARKISAGHIHDDLRRYWHIMLIARLLIPAWFAVGLFALNWATLVHQWLAPVYRLPVELPQLLIGISPAIVSWMALWWAHYPADRSLREQSMLIQLDAALPVHAAPGFADYFAINFRTHMLFNLLPILAIMLVRDIGATTAWALQLRPSVPLDLLLSLGSAITILLFSPQILRHVLPTQMMPESALRLRLEQLCRALHLPYANILLWNTHSSMGNAAVMGLIPRWRYLLVSDLILETMPDEQIVGVFAHEAGHIVHRHLLWMAMLVLTFILASASAGEVAMTWLEHTRITQYLPSGLLGIVVGLPLFILTFGFFARRLERQADVFSARMMQQLADQASRQRSLDVLTGLQDLSGLGSRDLENTYVGPAGAAMTCSALERIAMINNIPTRAREWLHGSIQSRVDYLQYLSQDPQRTQHFDHFMHRLMPTVVLLMVAFAVWTTWLYLPH